MRLADRLRLAWRALNGRPVCTCGYAINVSGSHFVGGIVSTAGTVTFGGNS